MTTRQEDIDNAIVLLRARGIDDTPAELTALATRIVDQPDELYYASLLFLAEAGWNPDGEPAPTPQDDDELPTAA